MLKNFNLLIKITIVMVLFLFLTSDDSKKKEVITKNFFGIHVNNSLDSSNYIVQDNYLNSGSIRFWDTGTSWRNLEFEKGKFNFNSLDRMVSLALKNKQEILLTLGQPPNWATNGKSLSKSGSAYNSLPPNNMEDWRNYVKTVGERYNGKIKYYEIWNEPNLEGFYSGTVNELVNLTKEANLILKEINPDNKIISPSVTNGIEYLDSYFKAGGYKYIDIIGVHLYVSPLPPEETISVINEYKQLLAKYKVSQLPIWNTEWTWLNFNLDGDMAIRNSNFMPEYIASAYLARTFFIDIGMGINRSFFYGFNYSASKIKLVSETDSKWIAMAGIAFKNAVSWLDGAEILDFKYKNGIYLLEFLSNEGKKSYIMWSEKKESRFKLKLDIPKGIYYSVIGEAIEYSGDEFNLTQIPVLFSEK